MRVFSCRCPLAARLLSACCPLAVCLNSCCFPRPTSSDATDFAIMFSLSLSPSLPRHAAFLFLATLHFSSRVL